METARYHDGSDVRDMQRFGVLNHAGRPPTRTRTLSGCETYNLLFSKSKGDQSSACGFD